MKKLLMAAATAATLACAAPAAQAAIVFNLGGPDVNLGPSETYTDLGSSLSVTAYGFDAASAPTNLFGKDEGPGERGLGLLTDPTGQGEIHVGSGFIQLDVSALFGKVNTASFIMNSTTEGETWGVFGSNTLGTLGGQLTSGSDELSHALPNFGAFKYYGFAEINNGPSAGDNVLLTSLTVAQVPEPATWALMIMGFGAAGAMLRRQRALALV